MEQANYQLSKVQPHNSVLTFQNFANNSRAHTRRNLGHYQSSHVIGVTETKNLTPHN